MFTAVTASLFCVRPAQAFTVTPLWITSNSGVPIPPGDTLPNAAFVDDPAVVSDKRLDSLPIPLPPASSLQLTFRHNFNLEASDMDPNLGFDGGVLELSTDSGNTFQDILAAGGSFVTGGYNRTIDTDRGSPTVGGWPAIRVAPMRVGALTPSILLGAHRFRARRRPHPRARRLIRARSSSCCS